MQKSRSHLTYAVILSVVFFIVGYYFSGDLFEMMLPNVEGVKYQTEPFNSHFYTSLLYGFGFGIFPIFTFFTCKIAGVESLGKKLVTLTIILVCSVSAVVIRHEILKSNLEESKHVAGADIGYQILFPTSQLYYEYYMLGGVIVGCIISFFLFKKRAS